MTSRPSRLTRQESQEQTREKLRQSALRAISRHGVAGAGIEQIAREAGYSRGAFYSNYASKLEILTDIVEQRQVREVRRWRDLADKAENADDLLAEMSADFSRRVLAREGAVLEAELQLEADRNPEFRPIFQAYLDTLFDEMRVFFVIVLRRSGKAPPDDLEISLAMVRAMTLGLGSGTLLGSAVGRRFSPEAALLNVLRRIVNDAPPMTTAEAHTNAGRLST